MKFSPGFVIKLVISIIWDLLDFTVGRIPGFGFLFDFMGGFLAIALWRFPGVIAFWELIDVTEQGDAQIPTLTLIGLMTLII